ncbi:MULTISPECIES: hypothetical protein [Pediococcus]|uniref:Immunity protein n=2 Tax=Pediococcus TaxID=1253 RepID=A0A0R2IYV5_9LACO|nr:MULTISPECIES: hypothetical protein [Pediococcus]KRN67012.1 hypothetical protein IV80_GL001102 [Pediococcus cellicola]KRN83289.1 hypothetical protein IV87_GL001323 [Pediococcus ethanolidurans]SER29850.1 hypothetical protein SAMN04487973_10452 [Pediococcus ethanolidurans]GEL15055.1 hypothetical protein PCE01_08570 [Pediococcus cellicola]GEN94574.1 hypothetical protein PET01_06240 [Pediococcus ethanolidurans]
MNIEKLMGVVFLLVAVWQFYAFARGFKTLRTKSNKSTTAFSIAGTWYGLLFGILFLGFGMTLVLNGF